jgi:AP-1 complex subunit beta-1
MKELKKLRESLYIDERTKAMPKSTIKNSVVEEIVREGEIFVKKKNLANSI